MRIRASTHSAFQSSVPPPNFWKLFFSSCSWASTTDGTMQESSSSSSGPTSHPPHPHTPPAPDSQKLPAVPVRVTHSPELQHQWPQCTAEHPTDSLFSLFFSLIFLKKILSKTPLTPEWKEKSILFAFNLVLASPHLLSSITMIVYRVSFLANLACFELHIAIVSQLLTSLLSELG